MAIITSERNLITVEEMETGSAAAESTMNRVGANLNLLLSAAPVVFNWTANGPYSNQGSPQTKIDGERGVYDSLYCCGYLLSLETAGSSGTLEIDIIRVTSGGSSASIFTITPKLVYTSGNNSRLQYDFRSATALRTAAGGTQGTLAITDFNAGDVLYMNINNHQVTSDSFSFELVMRAR